MIDYLIRKLPNNRILVIDNHTKERKILKPKELGEYFEDLLQKEIESQEEEDRKIEEVERKLKEGRE